MLWPGSQHFRICSSTGYEEHPTSEICCPPPDAAADPRRCPGSGFEGEPVGWTTVAALTLGPLPPRQDFRLCRDSECEVVYYGSAGAVLGMADLRVRPGFKNGSDGLVCYCFSHREADLARQLGEQGATDILDAIKHEVRAGHCACEVRHPSGRCCLEEVQAAIHRLAKELGAEA